MFAAPHETHVKTNLEPHSWQNLRDASFGVPQLGQFTFRM